MAIVFPTNPSVGDTFNTASALLVEAIKELKQQLDSRG